MAEERIDNPDRAAYARANQDAMYRMLTGASPADIAHQVHVLGGTRAAAQAAGVSQRTVQRWITTTGAQRIKDPRAANKQALNNAFTQARSTRAGRERIISGRRATLMRHNGARMKGSAKAGIVTPGGERAYIKSRTFDHHVPAGVMDATYEAYLSGGETAAYGAFNDGFGDEYGQGGLFFDSFLFTDMSKLGFTPDTGE
jgi:hypothetical protein